MGNAGVPSVLDSRSRHGWWVYFSHMLGAALLAELAGLIRDGSGSYTLAFVIAGWLAMAAGLAALLIRRARVTADPVLATA